MGSNIEIEAKVLINKDEYNKVIEHLHLDAYRRIKQTNYYIDTDNRDIKNNGYALRVREKNQEFELTLKTPLSEGLLEKNESISWRVFEDLRDNKVFPDGGIKKFLAILEIDTNELKIITSLTTERIEIEYKNNLLAVDKNTYGNNVDYEVEVESTSMSGAEETLKSILEECEIKDFSFNKKSKQSRALSALK